MNRLKSLIHRHLQKIHSRIFGYRIIYSLGFLYSKLLHVLSFQNFKPPYKYSKILIIYSKYHFDPDYDTLSRPLAFNSAANLARNIYRTFSGYEVIYRDQHEPLLDIYDFDIIFGILSKSFLEHCKRNPNARRILFLVNCHPLFRIKVLAKEALENNVNIPTREYVSPFLPLRCMQAAQSLLLIGNKTVEDTYRTYGTFNKKIQLMNSGVNTEFLFPQDSLLSQEKISVLFCATDLGLRKGILRLISLWNQINETNIRDKVELVVMGQNIDFQEEVQKFLKINKNVVYKGWIDSTTEEYRKTLQSSHIVLGLSLEEGQVGTILEAMSTGAIPIITKECGIPISQEDGYLLERFDIKEIISIIQDLIKNSGNIYRMRINSRNYIIKNHTWKIFSQAMEEIVLCKRQYSK